MSSSLDQNQEMGAYVFVNLSCYYKQAGQSSNAKDQVLLILPKKC